MGRTTDIVKHNVVTTVIMTQVSRVKSDETQNNEKTCVKLNICFAMLWESKPHEAFKATIKKQHTQHDKPNKFRNPTARTHNKAITKTSAERQN